MADNTQLNTGSGGDTIASDDIAGIKHQRVKLSVGADGTATDAVPISNGMDVTGAAVQAVGLVGQFDDSATGTVTEDQFAPVRISSRRAVLVEGVASGTVVPVSDGGGALTVDNGGTFATQVDGAALTALQLIDDGVYTDDTSTHSTGSSKGYGMMAAATPTDGSVNANDIGMLAMTVDRKLHVAVMDALPAGTAAIGKLAANSGVDIGDVDVLTLPNVTLAAGTNTNEVVGDAAHDAAAAGNPVLLGAYASATAPTDVSADADAVRIWALRNGAQAVQLTNAGVLTLSGSGTATGALRVELPTNGTGVVGLNAGTNAIGKLAANSGVDIGDVDILSIVPGTGATNLGKAEDAAHASGDTGVMALAVRAAAPTERSAGPTDGDYEPLATNEVGALWGTLTPSANGGCSTFMASGSDGSSILVATAQAIKASAGVLYGYYAYNPEASAIFVHFYNTAAASVTVGTTNPLFTIAIPAGSAANLALPYGITFSNAGWSCAATTTAGGTTAPTTGISLVAWYK